MSPTVLVRLRERRVMMEEVNGNLRASAAPGAINDEIRRLIRGNKAELLRAIRGEIEPIPSVRSLADAYRKKHGSGFRAAFLRETGCDHFMATPSWFQLYLFHAWVAATPPREGAKEGRAQAKPPRKEANEGK
jgi:hypothetical protein